jgi:hypothetical protein
MHLFGFIYHFGVIQLTNMLKTVLIFLLGVQIVSNVLLYLQNVIIQFVPLNYRVMADLTITLNWEF